jgi:hypothetical protein
MLYREMIAVCSQIHTKNINTLCGQNVELVNVETHRTHVLWPLTVRTLNTTTQLISPKHSVHCDVTFCNLNSGMWISISQKYHYYVFSFSVRDCYSDVTMNRAYSSWPNKVNGHTHTHTHAVRRSNGSIRSQQTPTQTNSLVVAPPAGRLSNEPSGPYFFFHKSDVESFYGRSGLIGCICAVRFGI